MARWDLRSRIGLFAHTQPIDGLSRYFLAGIATLRPIASERGNSF